MAACFCGSRWGCRYSAARQPEMLIGPHSTRSANRFYQENHAKRVDEGRRSHITEVHMKRDKSKSVLFLQISLGALLLGLFIGGVAFPQTPFFQGKSLTIIQSSAPGGVGDM